MLAQTEHGRATRLFLFSQSVETTIAKRDHPMGDGALRDTEEFAGLYRAFPQEHYEHGVQTVDIPRLFRTAEF